MIFFPIAAAISVVLGIMALARIQRPWLRLGLMTAYFLVAVTVVLGVPIALEALM